MGADPTPFPLVAPVICIVGPTASGKTALSQALAANLGGEVVSADSMQIYRGMDVGTGKIAVDERIVAHHGLDLVDPGMPYSAALFQVYARSCFRAIDARGHRTVLCGGTGLYVRAAIDAYEFPQGNQIDNPIRNHYELIAREQGADALWDILQSLDAESASLVPPGDVKRVIRALELLEHGTTYAAQRAKLASIPQLVSAHFIGLAVDPAILNERIDRRVEAMLDAGLVDEVKNLLHEGFREGITAPKAIGYKEIVAALDGVMTMDEAVQRIKVATHRYAKRQRTWFRKDRRIRWLCADSPDTSALVTKASRVLATMDSESK